MANALMSAANAAEAASPFNKAKKATAEVPSIDQAPTSGKSIPIVIGAVKMTGDVIWIHTFLNSKNECRCHVAVCFGRNTFGRAMSLLSLASGGNYIYRRSGGKTVDPPSAVRFYDGTQTEADPKIKHYEGAAKTPAFKGYIYAVLEDVKLGDFSAEFTDAGTTGTTYTYDICDSSLDGLELKYSPYTGLYYALENPGTTSANIITSDGCTVLRRARIKFPGINVDEDGRVWKPAVYKLDVIHCSDLLTVVGYPDHTFLPLESAVNLTPAYQWILHPDSGVLDGGWPWYTGPGSTYQNVNPLPESIDIEPKACFALAGYGPGQLAVLRFLDRGDIWWKDDTTSFFGVANPLPLGPESNLSGVVFNMRDHYPYNYDPNNRLGWGRVFYWDAWVSAGSVGYAPWYSEDKALVSRRMFISNDPYLRNTSRGWWLDEAPFLDDFIYLTNKGTYTDLGGYRIDAGHLTVYRLAYQESGISVSVSAEIVTTDGWGGSNWTVTGINYEPKEDVFLISADPPTGSFVSPRIYKFSVEGFVSYIDTGLPGFKLLPANYGIFTDGYAALKNNDGSSVKKIDINTGDVTDLYSGAASATPVVDMTRHLVSVPTTTALTKATTNQVSIGDILLTDLLTDCCTFKGYDAGDLVFQGLDGATIKGMLIESTIRLTDLFNRLGTLFSFTFVETDRKLKFLKKRASGSLSIDANLTADDLAISGGEVDGWLRTIQRASANNLLSGMDLEFVDPAKNYENSTIKVRRPAATFDLGASTRLETLSIPVTIDAATAYALLFESFYTILQKQNRVAFSLMPWSARVEPGDCISIDINGVVTTGVAVRVTTNEAFSQDVEMEIYQASGETQISAPEVPDDTTPDAAVGWYIPLEIPFIRATDYADASKSVRYHGITTKDPADWAWADLYSGTDGTNFTKLLEYSFSPMTVAEVQNAVGLAPLPFAMDDVNEIVVSVLSGSADDFQSTTYLAQMNGANLCAFGMPGRWELISFQTVTDNMDGTLSLTGLQRGLFGTHVLYTGDGTNEHQVGDRIVFLDPVKIAATQRLNSDIGLQEWFAIKTPGVELNLSREGPCEFKDVAMLQFQPANLKAEHTAGSSDLVVTWDEVSAIPGVWSDGGGDTPMHAPVTYRLTFSGTSVDVTTTGSSYTWTGYGAWFGADSNADGMTYVTLTPNVTGVGDGYPITAASIQKTT